MYFFVRLTVRIKGHDIRARNILVSTNNTMESYLTQMLKFINDIHDECKTSRVTYDFVKKEMKIDDDSGPISNLSDYNIYTKFMNKLHLLFILALNPIRKIFRTPFYYRSIDIETG